MGIKHKTLISVGFILNANFSASRATKMSAIIVGLIFLYSANYVWASSGGVMGGSDWDSSSDSSSYSSSSDDSSSYSHSYSSYQCSSCGSSSLDCSSCGDDSYSQRTESSSVSGFVVFAFCAGIMIMIAVSINNNTQRTTVIKLQIGLFDNIRPLQYDLNQTARTADTSTRGGMRSILTGTLESLIAHYKSCTSAYSSSKILSSMDEGKKMFNQLFQCEQGKFDEETLVNVNNVTRERTESTVFAEVSNMHLVITILVATQGRLELCSSINTCGELMEALQKLLSIPESKYRAVRVLWTPQQELDTLSDEQLHEDYPLLRPLRTT